MSWQRLTHTVITVALVFFSVCLFIHSYHNDRLYEQRLKVEQDEVAYQKYEAAEWEKCYRWWKDEQCRTSEKLVERIKYQEHLVKWLNEYRDRWIKAEEKLQKVKDAVEERPDSPGKGKP